MNDTVKKIADALTPVAPERYTSLASMPADVLANRVVSSLILEKGNLVGYAKVIEALILNMRKEYEASAPTPGVNIP